MGSFSITHLILIAVIALLFFGPSRLPSLGQSLGKAIRGFKDGLSGEDQETQDSQRSVGSNRPQEIPGPQHQQHSNQTQASTEQHSSEKDPQTKS